MILSDLDSSLPPTANPKGAYMLLTKSRIKLISFILIVVLLQSCTMLKTVPVNKTPFPSLEKRFVRLVWNNKPGKLYSAKDRKWYDREYPRGITECYIAHPTLKDDILSGTVRVNSPWRDQKYMISVYLDESLALPDSLPGAFAFSTSHIKGIEIYRIDIVRIAMIIPVALVWYLSFILLIFS